MVEKPAGVDEFPISEVPATELWGEHYAFLFSDPRTRASVYCTLGRWVGDPAIWREVITVVLPGREVLFAKTYGYSSPENGRIGNLAQLTIVKPERELRLRFSGPVIESTNEELLRFGSRDGRKSSCRIDLTFRAAAPVWNVKMGHADTAGSKPGLPARDPFLHGADVMHYEQIGTCDGTVAYDGYVHHYRGGYAARDHSRSVRDVTQYRWHHWLNGWFPSNRGFYSYAVQLQGKDSPIVTKAAVVHNGTLFPAEVAGTSYGADAAIPAIGDSIILTSELGRMEISVDEVLTSFPTSMVKPFDISVGRLSGCNIALLTDQSVRLTCDAEEGYGWCERGYADEPL